MLLSVKLQRDGGLREHAAHAPTAPFPFSLASLKLDKHAIVALSFTKNLTDCSENDHHILQIQIGPEGDKIAALKYLRAGLRQLKPLFPS